MSAIIKASNASEVVIQRSGYTYMPVMITIQLSGSSKGASRAFLSIDQAGEVAAALSNLIDAVKRGD